jgi:hypothetical protein
MSTLSGKLPIIEQAADVPRRARRLPVGSARNDLRQLAQGLLSLHRAGMRANVQIVETPILAQAKPCSLWV